MQQGKKFLSELKLHSDYFKWNDTLNRYENWGEAIDDIINGHERKYKSQLESLQPYLEEARESMKDMLVLASQRNLQFRYEQIIKHNARMYNCCVTYCDRPDVFGKSLYVLLCGTGLGISVLKKFIDKLPKIEKRTNGTKTFVIDDSIEGWAEALNVLMSSYYQTDAPIEEYQGYIIHFDYSKIRPQGSYLSGGFKAPGPDGLKQSLERIESLIENWIEKEGTSFRPILAYDIIMHSADAVLSGGVRRSAVSIIVDREDDEMINAKVGDWRKQNPQRARSNNSVLLVRGTFTEEYFKWLMNLNQGANDIGFVFGTSDDDLFNPCFEIKFIAKLPDGRSGFIFCNLNEINASLCKDEKTFYKACRNAAILGTLQAGYTDFPFLGSATEELVRGEALLGVSITGWMTQPFLFNEEILKKGAEIVKQVNEEVANIIGINPGARCTTVKPSGNSSVILGTSSGIHPEHSKRYFRVMQLNKDANTAKWLKENMPEILEESLWSANNTDYCVFVPIENTDKTIYKEDMKGIKHLELIKLVQNSWVEYGTRPERSYDPKLRHNVSCTVIIDDYDKIGEYLFTNQNYFGAVSFLSDFGDKDYTQAPFTSILNTQELVDKYGTGVMFASGLIVDGLHCFNDNLWEACESVLKDVATLEGTRQQVLLKKDWVRRVKKFSKNYFKNNLQETIYCIKDVHLWHKWNNIGKSFKSVDFSKILEKPEYKDIDTTAGMSCSGGACEITFI
jgi:ribonucleoside-triphosphate reductase